MNYIKSSLFFLLLFFASSGFSCEKKITVTSFPLYLIVKMVAGENSHITTLIKGDASIHAFQLKPSHIKILSQSDLIFYTDDQLETFMPKIKESISNKAIDLIRASGIKVQNSSEYDCTYHDMPFYKGHYDTHFWLDPISVSQVLATITKTLIDCDNKNRELYETNLKKALRRIENINAKISNAMQSLKDKKFVVLHDAYKYFSCRYSMQNIIAFPMHENNRISIKKVMDLQNKGLENACVIYEHGMKKVSGLNIGKTFIEGAKPTGYGASSYEEMMENILNSFQKCSKSKI